MDDAAEMAMSDPVLRTFLVQAVVVVVDAQVVEAFQYILSFAFIWGRLSKTVRNQLQEIINF